MGGGSEGSDAVVADSRLLANQRLWVSPEVDVTSRLTEVVQKAGGSLTRVLSGDIFALVVPEIVHGTREMNFAIEHDLAIVTEEEAIEQIEAQVKASAVPLLTEPADDLVVVPDLVPENTAVDDSNVANVEAPTVDEPSSDPDLLDVDLPDADLPDTDLPDSGLENTEPEEEIVLDESDLEEDNEPVASIADHDELVDDLADLERDELDPVEVDDLARDAPADNLDVPAEVAAPPAVETSDNAAAAAIPTGWYPVAGSPGDERFHDGTEWTGQFRSGDGDPLAASMAFMVDEKNRWLAAAVLPALAVIIGSLGPWANLNTDFGGVSVPGVDVTGALAVPLAMLSSGALAFAALRTHRTARLGGTIGFGLLALLGLYETTNLDAQVADTSFANPSVGWGLWLVILASLAGIAVGVLLARFETNDQAE